MAKRVLKVKKSVKRFVFVGDLHGKKILVSKVRKAKPDAIFLTGDLGKSDIIRKIAFDESGKLRTLAKMKQGYMQVYKTSLHLVSAFAKIAPVYIIYGNVEYSNSDVRNLSDDLDCDLPFLHNDLKAISGVRIMNNRIARVGDFRIGGLQYFLDTSWMKEFGKTGNKQAKHIARRETAKAKTVLKYFGQIDILLCHQPPFGILDKVNSVYVPKEWKGKHAGSKAILSYVKQKKPQFVFCGHVHEGKGKKKVGTTTIVNLGDSEIFVLEK